MLADLPFAEVWGVDFEFISDPGERPIVVCMVARELRSGRLIRLWRDELCHRTDRPSPWATIPLIVAYAITAELSCFLRARLADADPHARPARSSIWPRSMAGR